MGSRMSYAEAAWRILARRGGGPMHYRDIAEAALKKKLVQTRAKNPASTMLGQMRRYPGRFEPRGRGFYRLIPRRPPKPEPSHEAPDPPDLPLLADDATPSPDRDGAD